MSQGRGYPYVGGTKIISVETSDFIKLIYSASYGASHLRVRGRQIPVSSRQPGLYIRKSGLHSETFSRKKKLI